MRVKSWWQGLDRIRLESSREHKPTSVLNNLWRTEERLFRDPDYATAYSSEIQKLEQAGYTTEVSQEMWESSRLESHGSSRIIWRLKNRIVFNSSFTHQANNCNELIPPCPNLSSSLLGILLGFRAVSSVIKRYVSSGKAIPEDRPLLQFLPCVMQRDNPPSVYEWQGLPFRTTCSPCCATYAHH